MKVGLEEYQHEAGECYDRQIVAHRGGPCGDPRCAYVRKVTEKAKQRLQRRLRNEQELDAAWEAMHAEGLPR